MKLKHKVALITGGAQGLGKAIAIAMANEGAGIAICDINPQTLAPATKEIEALGVRASAWCAMFRRLSNVVRAARAAPSLA
jgi:NAD(P)-dependent dehydrogenase (short-subunit alcohol dehydrogenase family)